MSPFNLYIAFDREIRNKKDGLFINTAEVTYWLNKAVQEFVDKKYEEFEENEDISQDLKGLYYPGVLSTFTISSDFLNCTSVNLDSLNVPIRYITNEWVKIQLADSSYKYVKITPVTQDTINIKTKDPFSQHIMHLGSAEPLRLLENSLVFLITDGTYDIEEYHVKFIKEPTLFTINSALDRDPITEFPHKSFKEILAIAVRMCLENYSKDRYKTYNFEESKTEL